VRCLLIRVGYERLIPFNHRNIVWRKKAIHYGIIPKENCADCELVFYAGDSKNTHLEGLKEHTGLVKYGLTQLRFLLLNKVL